VLKAYLVSMINDYNAAKLKMQHPPLRAAAAPTFSSALQIAPAAAADTSSSSMFSFLNLATTDEPGTDKPVAFAGIDFTKYTGIDTDSVFCDIGWKPETAILVADERLPSCES